MRNIRPGTRHTAPVDHWHAIHYMRTVPYASSSGMRAGGGGGMLAVMECQLGCALVPGRRVGAQLRHRREICGGSFACACVGCVSSCRRPTQELHASGSDHASRTRPNLTAQDHAPYIAPSKMPPQVLYSAHDAHADAHIPWPCRTARRNLYRCTSHCTRRNIPTAPTLYCTNRL